MILAEMGAALSQEMRRSFRDGLHPWTSEAIRTGNYDLIDEV